MHFIIRVCHYGEMWNKPENRAVKITIAPQKRNTIYPLKLSCLYKGWCARKKLIAVTHSF